MRHSRDSRATITRYIFKIRPKFANLSHKCLFNETAMWKLCLYCLSLSRNSRELFANWSPVVAFQWDRGFRLFLFHLIILFWALFTTTQNLEKTFRLTKNPTIAILIKDTYVDKWKCSISQFCFDTAYVTTCVQELLWIWDFGESCILILHRNINYSEFRRYHHNLTLVMLVSVHINFTSDQAWNTVESHGV